MIRDYTLRRSFNVELKVLSRNFLISNSHFFDSFKCDAFEDLRLILIFIKQIITLFTALRFKRSSDTALYSNMLCLIFTAFFISSRSVALLRRTYIF